MAKRQLMLRFVGSRYVWLPLISLLAACATATNRCGPDAAASLRQIYYTSTAGKVGHHLSETVLGVCRDACGDQQRWAYSAKHVGGTLPPGLKFFEGDGRIEGTPQQPGNWQIQVRFSDLECGDTESRIPNRTVNVPFRIEGDAPRRVP
jgi:hypothetical protein